MRKVGNLTGSLLALSLIAAPTISAAGNPWNSITELRERWLKALNAADVDGVMAGFDEGAVVMFPDFPTQFGEASIRSWYEEIFTNNEVYFDYTSENWEVDGDWAFEEWTVTVTVTPFWEDELVALGDPVQFQDSGVRVYRKRPDGCWKIDREAWNGDYRSGVHVSPTPDGLVRPAK